MFENMNLDVMNDKEMESFIQGLTEIINLRMKQLTNLTGSKQSKPFVQALILQKRRQVLKKAFVK